MNVFVKDRGCDGERFCCCAGKSHAENMSCQCKVVSDAEPTICGIACFVL